MANFSLVRFGASPFRHAVSFKHVHKTQPFTFSYSTRHSSQPPTKSRVSKYVGLVAMVAGGYGISVVANRYQSSSSNLPISANAEDVAAPPWSTFTLQARQEISSTASVFSFKSTQPVLPSTYYDSIFSSSIFAVDIAQPQLQIVREYTPLPPALDPATGTALIENDCAELHLLIRREHRGEVSSYIHGLPEGAEIRVSKPRAQVSLSNIGTDKDVQSIVMVVGGTGITAALQAIHALLEAPGIKLERETGTYSETMPHVHVLWANRRREDCLGGVSDAKASSGDWWGLGSLFGLSKLSSETETELGLSPIIDEIRRLKAVHGERLKVDYFVDEEGTFITAGAVESAIASKPKGKSYVAVSGPEGFMANFAGEKRMLKNKITSRPSSGLLAGVKQQDWELMVLS